jgi:hypothetical protein
MPNLIPHKPSAAMLVAVTALVSSFAGPAVADEVAQIAQSITSSKQIKNGSVTGADVKNNSLTTTDLLDGSVQSADIGTGQVDTSELAPNSVRGDKIPANTIDGSDIQDGSIDGRDIELGTLGKVPSAGRADTAASVDSVQGTEPLFWSRSLSHGQSVVLDQAGPFTFRGECVDAGGSGTQARVTVTTSESNSYFYSSEETDDDFDAGETRELIENTTTSANSYDTAEFIFWNPSGTAQRIDYDGEPFGVAVNTTGADCRLYGDATVSAG